MAAPMPGYPFDEVMAAGSFTQGSTIELSADAPVVEPYTLYMQGGLTLEYGKLSILLALTNMKTTKMPSASFFVANRFNRYFNQ